MSNHKIAGLLIPMASSKEVIKEFARYIKDAHPANAVHLTGLVRYAMKKEDLKDDDFEKEKVFKVLFPEEEYILSRMDKLYGRAVKLAERFLMNMELDKRPDLQNFLLFKSLNALQLGNHATKKLESNLENLPDAEEERYTISEKTHRKLFFQVERNLKEKKKNRLHLEKGFVDHDIATTIGSLKYCCEHISRRLMFGEPIKPHIQKIIDRKMAYVPYRDEIPLIDIKADTLIFLVEPTREKFEALKRKFVDYLGKLHSEKKVILTDLINGLAFIKHEDRLTEYFNLNKIGVENNLFVENQEIAPNVFNNVVYSATRSRFIILLNH